MTDEDALGEVLSQALSNGLYVNFKTKEHTARVTLILREKDGPQADESLEITGPRNVVVEPQSGG